MSTTLIVILVLLHVKHFLADFPLQNLYMLGKAKRGIDWILPLGAHCAVHATLSALIILAYKPQMVGLVVAEFFAHFVIDRLKCLYRLPHGTWAPEFRGKYLAKYYTAFGVDQLFHQLCYITMAYFLA